MDLGLCFTACFLLICFFSVLTFHLTLFWSDSLRFLLYLFIEFLAVPLTFLQWVNGGSWGHSTDP